MYKYFKRSADFLFSFTLLIFLWWLIILLIILATIDTKSFGFFKQKRIGQYKKPFNIYKIKTYQKNHSISNFGAILRQSKLDELPQLLNVFWGTMSFVGPRPDVPGFADVLKGHDSSILSVKPGITGPASIVFRNEEQLLKQQKDPDRYNKETVWPKKVELNVKYVEELSFKKDIYYLVKTIF